MKARLIALFVGLLVLGGLYFVTNHTPEADGASQPEVTVTAPAPTPDDSFAKGLKIN